MQQREGEGVETADTTVVYAPPQVESTPSRLTRQPVIAELPVDVGGAQLNTTLLGSACNCACTPVEALDAAVGVGVTTRTVTVIGGSVRASGDEER